MKQKNPIKRIAFLILVGLVLIATMAFAADDIAYVTFTGTGADQNVPLGFKPSYVRCFNITNGASMEWSKEMSSDSAVLSYNPVGYINTIQTVSSYNGVTSYGGTVGGYSYGFSVGDSNNQVNILANTVSCIVLRN